MDRAGPDLFARGRKPLCVARCILTIATGRGEALHNLDVAQQYLADRPEVNTERIGVIEFCLAAASLCCW